MFAYLTKYLSGLRLFSFTKQKCQEVVNVTLHSTHQSKKPVFPLPFNTLLFFILSYMYLFGCVCVYIQLAHSAHVAVRGQTEESVLHSHNMCPWTQTHVIRLSSKLPAP